MMLTASEIRGKSAEELQKELLDLRKKQFQLRIQRSTGQLANVAQFKEIRKDIARVQTILNEQKKAKQNG